MLSAGSASVPSAAGRPWGGRRGALGSTRGPAPAARRERRGERRARVGTAARAVRLGLHRGGLLVLRSTAIRARPAVHALALDRRAGRRLAAWRTMRLAADDRRRDAVGLALGG